MRGRERRCHGQRALKGDGKRAIKNEEKWKNIYSIFKWKMSVLHPNIDIVAKEALILEFKYHTNSSTSILLADDISTLVSWRCYFKLNMDAYDTDLISASDLVCPGKISFLHPLHFLLKISHHLLQRKTYWNICQPGCVSFKTNTFAMALKIWKLFVFFFFSLKL